jgi:hypothetical protein
MPAARGRCPMTPAPGPGGSGRPGARERVSAETPGVCLSRGAVADGLAVSALGSLLVRVAGARPVDGDGWHCWLALGTGLVVGSVPPEHAGRRHRCRRLATTSAVRWLRAARRAGRGGLPQRHARHVRPPGRRRRRQPTPYSQGAELLGETMTSCWGKEFIARSRQCCCWHAITHSSAVPSTT